MTARERGLLGPIWGPLGRIGAYWSRLGSFRLELLRGLLSTLYDSCGEAQVPEAQSLARLEAVEQHLRGHKLSCKPQKAMRLA